MEPYLRSYRRSNTLQRHGVRPRVNRFKTDFALHYHDFFEIELVETGKLLYEVNGVAIELSKGDLIAVSPSDLHKYTVLEESLVYRVSVNLKETADSVQRVISAIKFPFHAHYGDEQLRKIIDAYFELQNAISHIGEFDREIVGARATVFFSLCAEKRDNFVPKISRSYAYVSKATRYITENCANELGLEDVSAYLNISPSYFSRIFTENVGQSFVEYLAEKRVERARKLLSTTEESITEIAFNSGFNSFSAFSRSFKRIVGISPREFRNNVWCAE